MKKNDFFLKYSLDLIQKHCNIEGVRITSVILTTKQKTERLISWLRKKLLKRKLLRKKL